MTRKTSQRKTPLPRRVTSSCTHASRVPPAHSQAQEPDEGESGCLGSQEVQEKPEPDRI